MMFESELRHMYQAWQQGQDNYILDSHRFVEWAAAWNKASTDVMLKELQRYSWFKRLEA
jgi:aryl carrier-like protein